uniref:Glutamyl-tRNA amidotransferase subunit C n=1 Tax=Aegilops tauschii subsp. strangulata TaxID=200361 RepID=A0A453LPW7_AEGTS
SDRLWSKSKPLLPFSIAGSDDGHALRRRLGHSQAPLGRRAAGARLAEHPVVSAAAAPALLLPERSAHRGAGAPGAAGPSPPRQLRPHISLAARGLRSSRPRFSRWWTGLGNFKRLILSPLSLHLELILQLVVL